MWDHNGSAASIIDQADLRTVDVRSRLDVRYSLVNALGHVINVLLLLW